MIEMRESLSILQQALNGINVGSTIYTTIKNYSKKREFLKTSMEALIEHFKYFSKGSHSPVGEAYACVEAPKGEFGLYMLTKGLFKPYRCKIRAPGFAHLQSIDLMCRGHLLADVVAIIGTRYFCNI